MKMSYPHKLNNLTTREAIADAVYRASVGFDENDFDLLSSALTADILFEAPGITMTGIDAIKTHVFPTIGPMDTTHMITNMRINVDGDTATTASVTANFLAQHYPSGTGVTESERRLLGAGKYFLDMVKDETDGLWKAKKWALQRVWTEGDVSVMSAQ